jgi:hypothetical protein
MIHSTGSYVSQHSRYTTEGSATGRHLEIPRSPRAEYAGTGAPPRLPARRPLGDRYAGYGYAQALVLNMTRAAGAAPTTQRAQIRNLTTYLTSRSCSEK